VVAATWKHFQAAKDSAGKSVADIVIEGFLVIVLIEYAVQVMLLCLSF